MFERCLYFNVNALSRRVNKTWDEAFGEFGLSPSHAYLLRVVLAQPGIAQKHIAEELKLEKSTVTRFINALETKHLVTRKKSASGDNREYRILPTRKAERMKDKLEKKSEALYQSMLKQLGRQDLKLLVTLLKEAELDLK